MNTNDVNETVIENVDASTDRILELQLELQRKLVKKVDDYLYYLEKGYATSNWSGIQTIKELVDGIKQYQLILDNKS